MPCEWLGQKKGLSWSGSFCATSPLQEFWTNPSVPRRWWRGFVFVQLHTELLSALIRKALVPQCKRFSCLLVKDSLSGCSCRRQTKPLQHLRRLECPSERTVSRRNSGISSPNHDRSQLRLRMLLQPVMETISTAPVF